MAIPCTKCYDLIVAYDCEAWIAGLSVVKESPDVIIEDEISVSGGNAYEFYAAACVNQGGTWSQCGFPLTCWVCEINSSLYWFVDSGSEFSPGTLFCNYTANVSFPAITLSPSEPWLGPPFTLNIASEDPRIMFSPSSVEITTGFASDIPVTLSLAPGYENPIQGPTGVFSDTGGNCLPATLEQWAFNTTPRLEC